MPIGFMYLVAVMDWHSRYVLAWELSNTLNGTFCFQALEQALHWGKPEIFNTNQGVQFTANDFVNWLLRQNIRVSIPTQFARYWVDGVGRAIDLVQSTRLGNIMVERLWRSLKYEDIYLKEYPSVRSLELGLQQYFRFYNYQRWHQSLDYQTPAEVHFSQALAPAIPQADGYVG